MNAEALHFPIMKCRQKEKKNSAARPVDQCDSTEFNSIFFQLSLIGEKMKDVTSKIEGICYAEAARRLTSNRSREDCLSKINNVCLTTKEKDAFA